MFIQPENRSDPINRESKNNASSIETLTGKFWALFGVLF
jgi:hypothetical protein